jgi:hypothetical protein
MDMLQDADDPVESLMQEFEALKSLYADAAQRGCGVVMYTS